MSTSNEIACAGTRTNGPVRALRGNVEEEMISMGRTHADKNSETAVAAQGRQPAASKRSGEPETVRYIVNESGERAAVVLPVELYEKLLSEHPERSRTRQGAIIDRSRLDQGCSRVSYPGECSAASSLPYRGRRGPSRMDNGGTRDQNSIDLDCPVDALRPYCSPHNVDSGAARYPSPSGNVSVPS